MTRICVFCGSSPGRGESYLALARSLGAGLAASQLGLVYGGSKIGLMGAVADGCLEAGGAVVGVIPSFMDRYEATHRAVTTLHVVESMHERKAMMAELSAGFIALPGGIGTLEELFEIATWAYLGLHDKPLVLLDPDGYYDPLLAFLDHAAAEGFVRPVQRARFQVARAVDEALDLATSAIS